MNKKSKFIISWILSLTLFTTMMFSVSAVQVQPATEKIVSALQNIEQIKQDIGLSDVDFEELSIAEPVCTYVYTADGFIPNNVLYPLKENGALVAWAVPLEDGQTTTFQITALLVDEVNAVLTENTAFALIYDYANCYLYDGNAYHLLKQKSLGVEGRSVLQPEANPLPDGHIQLTEISTSTDLAYTPPAMTRVQTYYSCPVSFVSQMTVSNSQICWAASIACIVNYKKGTNHTAIDVAKKHYGETNFNRSLPFGDEVGILRWDYYLLLYSYKAQAPSGGVISRNIRADYPIFGTFRVSNGNGHACVISGVDIIKGTITVMDPEVGFCGGTVTSSGYQYSRTDVGLTCLLIQATCRYWST